MRCHLRRRLVFLGKFTTSPKVEIRGTAQFSSICMGQIPLFTSDVLNSGPTCLASADLGTSCCRDRSSCWFSTDTEGPSRRGRLRDSLVSRPTSTSKWTNGHIGFCVCVCVCRFSMPFAGCKLLHLVCKWKSPQKKQIFLEWDPRQPQAGCPLPKGLAQIHRTDFGRSVIRHGRTLCRVFSGMEQHPLPPGKSSSKRGPVHFRV